MLAALVNGLVVSVPLTVVVWFALGVSRRRVNAATRYAVWWLLLALVVCLPLRYVPLRPAAPQYARIATAALANTAMVLPSSVPSRSVPMARVKAPRFPLRVVAGAWSTWITALWAIAALVMMTRLIVSYALLWKMKRDADDAPNVVAASAQSALERLGVTRRVRVAIVTDAVSPMVAGPFRPTILLPAVMLESMSAAEIAQICLHEAAHLARRDDWALMFQRVIEAVFALHPLIRWIASRINLEREIACDDLVVSVTGSARPYASCLTRIAELAGGLSGSPAAAAVSDERSHLSRRVEMLLDKTRHAGTRLLRTRLAVLAGGLAVVTLLAAHTPGVLVFAAAQTVAAPPPVRRAVAPAAPQPAVQATPATPPVAATAAQPAAQPEKPAIRVAVSVTDPMNRFVTGLDAGAFHVFENGVEQKIVDVTARKEPVSVAIIWDEKSGLRELRDKVAQLERTYKPSFPEIRVAEAELAEIESHVLPSIDVAGTQVSMFEVGENQSLSDGLQFARERLQGTPAEQAAIVLVLGSAGWPGGRIAVVNAYGFPIYALGIASPGSEAASSSSAIVFPVLVSQSGVALAYPAVAANSVAANQVSASLSALLTQLANEYVVGYVPSGPAETGTFRNVDVRLTPRAGLPALTARVSTGRR